MLSNYEEGFDVQAWGAPSGGLEAVAQIKHTFVWPGGAGVMTTRNNTLENGATLTLDDITTDQGVAIGKLNDDLHVSDYITTTDDWFFSLPAGTKIRFLISLPRAAADPPGHAIVQMYIARCSG